jgi:hypothetical protein
MVFLDRHTAWNKGLKGFVHGMSINSFKEKL